MVIEIRTATAVFLAKPSATETTVLGTSLSGFEARLWFVAFALNVNNAVTQRSQH